jgi:eukaryotic-like serine/threonine-protein kinase
MRVHMADRTSWELAEGDEIAQGRSVMRLLGGGRRYEAYVVWDERVLAPMVAKLIRPDQAEDGAALRALRREAEALEALAHPVILRGFDAVLDPPHPHVLVEHLEGPTLRELIRSDGPLPAERVRMLGMSVASALHYMAAEGWLHLDLKPGNILMSAPPRVIDLSLARTLERAARVREPIGTNAYMAPEQCEPSGELSPAADIWGLGATLYHALTGRRPFRRSGSAERFPQLTDGMPRPPSAVPRDLADTVLACLRPDAAARPSAGELFESLRKLG